MKPNYRDAYYALYIFYTESKQTTTLVTLSAIIWQLSTQKTKNSKHWYNKLYETDRHDSRGSVTRTAKP